MEKRWKIEKHDRAKVAELASELDVPPLVAAMLITRGYDDRERAFAFLNPTRDDLHEPELLKDLTKSVERILKAIE
ncbi:MAG TPA: hypothetical protein PKM58_04940, partial [Pyrinomonadaceae bacterium]|nr:hypothetical protein [Pyrinomonadaceae bacterium]